MTTPQQGRIFISYRRADSKFAAGRIYDRLAAHFGEEAIFMDVEAIDAGLDFVKALEDAVQSCDVLVALIGRQWLHLKDERGKRRLDNPEDFVRIEIAAALNRDIRVIPALVDGTDMPRSTELPENLKPLARRNALQVNHRSFNADANRLVAHLESALKAAEESKIIKAQALKEKEARTQRQAEIEKLLTQADTAIALSDWQLAAQKLKNILNLDARHIQAQAKLEIVEEKIAEVEEEKKRRESREQGKERKRIQQREEARNKKAALEKTRQDRIAREKQAAEEKARQDALKKAQQQERADGIKKLFASKGKFIAIGIVIFACLIFGGGYLITKFFPSATPAPSQRPPAEAPATVVLPESTTYISPTAVSGEYGIGSTMISDKDGMTLLYVPAGEFEMGSEDGDSDEKPVHTVDLDAYWIDQTEVTNAMYAKCVSDGVCDPPNNSGSYTRESYYGNSEFDKYPVIYVSWEDASAYCSWAKRRLPTEAEWEKAARGTNGRIYPWGDEIDESYANYGGNVGDTTSVGNYEKGASFYGAYDMAGNVWEWVADWYDENYYANSPSSNPLGSDTGEYRALRGGSWLNNENGLRSATRHRNHPTDTSSNYGFRCSRSP